MHDQRAHQHDANRHTEGELERLVDAVFSPCAVVIGQNRNQSVVETEDRHEEEALQLEIDAEDCGRSCREYGQDHVHAVGHDGTDGHHEDGRHADKINLFDDIALRLQDALPAQVNVGVELEVHDQTQDGSNALAQNCGIRCAGNAELGEAEEAEDHDRVKDDVNDRTGGLADHAQLGAARGLQESLEVHLEEEAQRHACDDGEVCVAVFDDFGGCGGIRAGLELHGERPVGAKNREQQESDKAAEGQEDAHIGGCVGPVEALLAE